MTTQISSGLLGGIRKDPPKDSVVCESKQTDFAVPLLNILFKYFWNFVSVGRRMQIYQDLLSKKCTFCRLNWV